jgi:photosystem II stability/assembly factor-like uncharacterized protein
VAAIRKEIRTSPPANQVRKVKDKPSSKLKPHELFYLDRNYPSDDVNPGLFQQRLAKAIQYDEHAGHSNRGLDHPWTLQGPGNIGGRVNAIAVHPADSDVILIGFSQGGIYRTVNAGLDWAPVFDDQASLSISHISFDPHDPKIVWASTGDVNISGYPFIGSGVYRSEDTGKTWQYSGLGNTGVLSKVMVDPNDQDIIYAGSMGFPSQKGNERGLFRTSDGGISWQKTLTIDDSTGIIDLVTDPFKAGRVYAAGWTRIRSSVITTNVTPGTCLYKSEDYGQTWINITNGLPTSNHSRTSIDITNDGTLFISYLGTVEQGDCIDYTESLLNVYKSFDSGLTWDTLPTAQEHGLPCDLFGQFGWYFEILKVNPQNPLDIFLLGVDIYRTLDGGLNWFEAAPPWWTYEVHADKHDLVFAHDSIYLGTDGGAYKTDIDQLDQWVDIENIPATQFYRTTFNPHQTDQYYGGAQDNGTTGGNASAFNDWYRILGGDGFQPLFDPSDSFFIYAMTQNGNVYYSDNGGIGFDGLNEGLYGSRYWDMPLVMSSQDPKILYCGGDRVFRINMNDTLRVWTEISPDLTRGDSILGSRYPCITSIAQSSLDTLRLYAGTQDGFLWTTADGGITWTNITDGTPGFYVTSITCSTIHAEGVIATYSGYRDNDHQPYIYRSDNAGLLWQPIQSDLPMMGVNSLYLPEGWNDTVLFAATDGGVYVSKDAGDHWERVGSNMPYMPVYDLDFNPDENTLIAATFSRGIMTFPMDELDLINGTHDVDAAQLEHITVYPTIANDFFSIDFSGSELNGEEATISLMTSNGIIAGIYTHRMESGNVKRIQREENMSPGLYVLYIKTEHGFAIFKIIITG